MKFFFRSTLYVLLLVSTAWSLSNCDRAPMLFAKSPKKPEMNPYLEAFIQDYVQFFEAEMARTQLPGAALVIAMDTSIIYMKGFGVKALGESDSVDAHTVFRIGSLSKAFAGMLTAMLVQDSVLSFSDPVVQHVPYFQLKSPEQTQRIQLRHLLSHSAGLPYHTYTDLIEAGYDIPSIVTRLKTVKLAGKEGEVFSYQNATFAVMEEVVRARTGKSYAVQLHERIFSPLGMADASASYEGILSARNKAFPHEGYDSTWARTEFTQKFYNAVAAGGVNASISDMGQWLLLLLGNRPDLIRPALLDSVFAPQIKTNAERRFFKDWLGDSEAYYGFGWRILQTPEDTIIYHGGYVNSFKGDLAIHRKDRIAVCILMNGAGSMSGTLIPGFFERYRMYADSIKSAGPGRSL